MKTLPAHLKSLSDKGFESEAARQDPLENLCRFRDHGITHLHFSTYWTREVPITEAEIAMWEAALAESGVQVLDVHGYHSKKFGQLWDADPERRDVARTQHLARLELCRRWGCDAMVVHVPTGMPEVGADTVTRFLDELAAMEERARACGVVVALENHYHAHSDQQTMSAAFARFDADYIGFCFDPGHALISGNTDWLLANALPRLKVLHLNDNDGEQDQHWLPLQGYGTADWQRIVTAIGESPYDKPLQMEVSWQEARHAAYDDFLAEAAQVADSLVAQIRGICDEDLTKLGNS